jgi:Flp pilus assembly protein CpaB
MNLLSLIIIFLALAIVGAIAYIAWELTSERSMPRSDKEEPGASTESNDTPGSGEQS